MHALLLRCMCCMCGMQHATLVLATCVSCATAKTCSKPLAEHLKQRPNRYMHYIVDIYQLKLNELN